MPKLAVIDLGTNVIKVLVGSISQTAYRVLYEEKITGTMSQQPLSVTPISLEVQQNIIDILLTIKEKLVVNDVDFIIAKATSLLREAPNAAEVIAAIRLATGIEIGIISDIEEASLIYLGINASHTLTHEPGLIVDIGGGSVECVIVNHAWPLWIKSFELGIGRVASQFPYNDPITPAQVDSLEDYYHTVLIPLFVATKQQDQLTKLIGSSGAFRTLLMLYHCHYAGTIVQANSSIKTLSIEQFGNIYARILTTPVHIWQKQVAIEPVFLKRIPLSAILINLIIRTCNLKEIVIANNSLTMGLFIREWRYLKDARRI